MADRGLCRFLFLADCQLGAYATFSGMTAEDIAAYAERDMQVRPVPRVEGFEWDAVRYSAAIDVANAMRPDFVVVGGDMIDDSSDTAQIEELLRISSGLDDDIPLHWVPGNHDLAADALVPAAHDLERYREIFGPDYYRFDFGAVRFVALNTVTIDHPERIPDELDEQLEFVAVELARAAADSVDHIVLLGHHPLFVASSDEPDSYWNLPKERRRILLDLIHRHGVRIAFAGHWHRNATAFDGDFEMVTSGPVGYPLGDDPSGYRVVDIWPGRLWHRYEALSR